MIFIALAGGPCSPALALPLDGKDRHAEPGRLEASRSNVDPDYAGR